MKRVFTRLFGFALLFAIATTAINAVSPQQGGKTNIAGQIIKGNHDKPQAGKEIVIFQNLMDPTKFQDNFYFWAPYSRHLNGDLGNQDYVNRIDSMDFTDANLNNLKINDHQVYFFPMGEKTLYDKPANSSRTIISFIKAVLDSGKRVVIFGHNVIGSAKNDPVANAFVSETLQVKDIGVLQVASGGTIYPYPLMGKNNDFIGQNQYISCNAIGIDNGKEYPAVINYADINFFKSKDESKAETFFYIGTKLDKGTCQVTENAVGIRAILKNKARIVLWCVGSENIHFSYLSQQVIQNSIWWSMMNNLDDDAPEIEILGGDLQSFGFSNVGVAKTKNVLFKNSGEKTLKIEKISFSNEYTDVIYPVDAQGNNIESSLLKQTMSLEPGQSGSIKIAFKPKADAENYLRTMTLRTNEQKSDGSGYGVDRNITFIGTGGQEQYDESFLSSNEDYLDFGMIYVDSSKTMNIEIHNKGDKPFTLSSLKISPKNSFFELKGIDFSKFTLQPKTFNTYQVVFTPTEEGTKHSAELQVWSDADNYKDQDYMPIPLYGAAEKHKDTIVDPGSVNEINLPEGRFVLDVSPNPASENLRVKYIWEKGITSNLDMWLLDLNGNKIMSLYSSRIESGEGALSFGTNGLASGTYYVLAVLRGKAARVPVIIVK